MIKNIEFLINHEKYSHLADQSQTIKSIKVLFKISKEKGNFDNFEEVLNTIDSVVDEKLAEIKRDL
ncbi:hypothetical protein [Tepidibacter aestuarii]|uniref:hypothetical protein n=1 Tax=Tepidibacter aestuarii TaxID=2925782 RepID=UPI0020BE419B|nr:hypothetical protein [Tepidibacter aestuarii]CAH2213201.1 protein of unknown function [Tepidibacter aestuarii]